MLYVLSTLFHIYDFVRIAALGYTDLMKKSMSGFTIIELLIVVVVVAILATVTLLSYSSFRERARVSAIAKQIVDLEKSLRVEAANKGRDSWWSESELSCATVDISARSITSMASNCNMPTLSPFKDVDGIAFGFDNENDTATACSSATGVNIQLRGDFSDLSFYQQLDTLIDDNTTNCGKLSRYDATRLFYKIAPNSSDF